MEERGHKGLVVAFAVLCVLLLIAVGLLLALQLRALEGRSSSDSLTLTEDVSDMVLIDITDEEAATYYHVTELGVYVLAVEENSQAYKMGIRSGDRIVSANGVFISSSDELNELESRLEYDEELVLVIARGLENELMTIQMGMSANLSI